MRIYYNNFIYMCASNTHTHIYVKSITFIDLINRNEQTKIMGFNLSHK